MIHILKRILVGECAQFHLHLSANLPLVQINEMDGTVTFTEWL